MTFVMKIARGVAGLAVLIPAGAKSRLAVLLGASLLLGSSLAHATHKVYSPNVEPGEFELEMRAHTKFDSDPAVITKAETNRPINWRPAMASLTNGPLLWARPWKRMPTVICRARRCFGKTLSS